jgi:alpha-tubulin suppressor-like RCC1 family protein
VTELEHDNDDGTAATTGGGGEVWSWGLGHFGVLGRPYTPFDYDADTAIEAFTGAGGGEGEVNAPVAAAAAAVAAAEAAPSNGDAVAAAAAVASAVASTRSAVNGREGALDADLMAHLDLINNLTLDDSSSQCIPMPIESLKGIRMVGTSAGHRHSLFLDAHGGLYSCGAGIAGCLGHGDTASQMYPVKIMSFLQDEEEGVAILQMSAGVDMSMAVSTTGDVYAWGKTIGGRIGLDPISTRGIVMQPRRVSLTRPKYDSDIDSSCSTRTTNDDGKHNVRQPGRQPIKAVDVECGYVHSIIVALDGTLHICGSVGVEGEADGHFQHQEDGEGEEAKRNDEEEQEQKRYKPRLIPDNNVWHRLAEPTDPDKPKPVERWKKFGKYEVKGRTKMLADPNS